MFRECHGFFKCFVIHLIFFPFTPSPACHGDRERKTNGKNPWFLSLSLSRARAGKGGFWCPGLAKLKNFFSFSNGGGSGSYFFPKIYILGTFLNVNFFNIFSLPHICNKRFCYWIEKKKEFKDKDMEVFLNSLQLGKKIDGLGTSSLFFVISFT